MKLLVTVTIAQTVKTRQPSTPKQMPMRNQDRRVKDLEDLLDSIDLTKLNANGLEEPEDDETILPDLIMTDLEKKIFHAIRLRWKTFHITQNDFAKKSLAMHELNNSCINTPVETFGLLAKETLQLELETVKIYDEILELKVALHTSLQTRLPQHHSKDIFIRKGYVIVLKAKPKKP